MTAALSVAMATYNGGRFITQQLESLALQTLAPAELVVCDDGSNDDTLACLESFSRHAPFPVRVHSNPTRLGYVENFLRAASLCSTDLVALCDQDDVWHHRKIERCTAAFDDERVLLCHHNVMLVDADLKPLEKFDQTLQKPGLHPPLSKWPGRYPWGLSQVFRRSLLALSSGLRRPRGYHSIVRIGHDEWIAFVAGAFGWTYVIDECLVDYRQHASNASGGRLKRSGFLSQVRRNDSENLRNIALSLADQSSSLREFRPACPPVLWEQVDHAIRRATTLSSSFAKRANFYDTDSRIQRVLQLSTMILGRTYGSQKADQLPPRTLARDLLFAFVGPE